MRGARHHLLSGLVVIWLTASGLGAGARAATTAVDEVDDPKMSRVLQAPRPTATPPMPKPAAPLPVKPSPPRLEPPPAVAPRIEVAKPIPPKVEPARPVPVAVVVEPPPTAELAVAPKPAPPPVADEGVKAGTPSVDVTARNEGGGARAEPPPANRVWPYAPRLKLAYRRFPFVRVGAPAGADPTTPTSTSESFESVSIDLYPISGFLRVGLSTQFGWETTKFDRSGDYFIAESASVGFQWPGRITPFVEALAGAGYMRRKAADLNLPTAYWQVGIDAGIEVYLAKRAYVSLSVGYLHPGNLFLMDQNLMSVKTDSWSLKFGVGI